MRGRLAPCRRCGSAARCRSRRSYSDELTPTAFRRERIAVRHPQRSTQSSPPRADAEQRTPTEPDAGASRGARRRPRRPPCRAERRGRLDVAALAAEYGPARRGPHGHGRPQATARARWVPVDRRREAAPAQPFGTGRARSLAAGRRCRVGRCGERCRDRSRRVHVELSRGTERAERHLPTPGPKRRARRAGASIENSRNLSAHTFSGAWRCARTVTPGGSRA